MDVKRIFRAANGLFVICGHQLHSLDLKKKDFKISFTSVICFLCYLAWYMISFSKHFANIMIMRKLQLISPFLFHCMRVHLFLGLKITVCVLYDSKRTAQVFTKVFRAFYKENCHFRLEELMAYFFLFSTIFIWFCVTVYDVCQLRLEYRQDDLMIGSAVLMPHLNVAFTLKFLCIYMWLLKVKLKELRINIEETFQTKIMNKELSVDDNTPATNDVNVIVVTQSVISTSELQNRTKFILQTIKDLKCVTKEFNDVIQKQMALLFIQNNLVLLSATHAFAYYDLYWYDMLTDDWRNACLVTSWFIFVVVLWDYICLFSTNYILKQEKNKFTAKLLDLKYMNLTLEEVNVLNEAADNVKLDEMFHLLWIFPINWHMFILGGLQIFCTIAVFVLYQYFDEKLNALE